MVHRAVRDRGLTGDAPLAAISNVAARAAIGTIAANMAPMPDPLLELAEELGGAPADLRETHISRVALAGPPGSGVALKQCRAVDFGFVDLSTPEARRAALEKELAVNDRFAPGVYRGVRELPSTNGPGGEPVLEMQRLDAADTLDAKVRRGEATAADLDAVLDHLIPLFEASERTPERGDPAVIRRNLTENHDALFAAERRFGIDLGAARLRSEQLLLLTTLEPALRDRADRGFVRDGHGDLRAEHVYLTGDGVKVLDGIAFCDRLRCVDVADDLAFLAWDLDRIVDEGDDRWTLENVPGERLLAGYLDRTGDDSGAGLLALYESYRAAVRAKVAALSSGDDPADWGPNLSAAGELAWGAAVTGAGWENAETFGGPVGVIVGGRSGSGKSTLAAAVADRIGATHLRTDALRKEALGLDEGTAAPPGAYADADRAAVYDRLLARCWGAMGDGRGVVADGTFLDPETRRRFADALPPAQGTLLFVWCECDDAVAEARLAAREAEGTDASDADMDVRRRQAVGSGGEEEPRFEEFAHVLRLDTNGPVDALCDRVVGALRVAAGIGRQ